MTAGRVLAIALVVFAAEVAPSAARDESDAVAEKLAAAPKPPTRPSWYAASVAGDERGGFLMVHFWSDGALFRSEAVIAGRKIVTVVSAEKYYVVDAVGGTGIAIERSDAAKALDGNRGRPFANEFEELLRNGGEHIRTEKVKTQTLDVYRVTDGRGRRTVWMTQTDPPVPLRVETYDRESATTGRVDYMNWMQGPLIDESFFKVDARWRIEQISYKAYRKRIRGGPVGPAPVLYRHLLHGESRD